MIKGLQIRNFMTHEKMDIAFGPHVNSIIGRNAAGKSTILRALRWVVRNKPAGDSMINWDATKASVRLLFDNNKITRTKGNSINIYRLNEKEFKAFGNEVPPEIGTLLGLSDINFQGQHDAPFWFCETAGEVSRQLNTIVNLDIIDKTLSNIQSAIRKSRTTIEVVEERLQAVKIQKESLIYVREMDKDLGIVEGLGKQKEENAVEAALLDEILKSVYLYGSERDNAAQLIVDAKSALNIGRKTQEIILLIKNLSNLVDSCQNLQIIIKSRPPIIKHLETLKQEIEDDKRNIKTLQNLIEDITEKLERRNQVQGLLDKWQQQLKEITKERCPLCGAKTKK